MLDRYVGLMAAAGDVGLALSGVLGGAVSAPGGRVVLCIIAGPSPALLMVVAATAGAGAPRASPVADPRRCCR